MDFSQNPDYKRIFSFSSSNSNRITARESNIVEFKESFNWLSKALYAKSIAAFANNKGGYIIFGVKNSPRELVGLQNNNFEDIDEAKITSYLNGVFSPEIIYEKFYIEVRGKLVGIFHVHKRSVTPVVCIKNDDILKESDIYFRYNAKSERIKYPELKSLLDEIREYERKDWMSHLEKISKIGPSNAAILDVLGGEISGTNKTLVIDRKLVSKIKFINQGTFHEKGRPVLKLIGDVKPVSIVTSGKGKTQALRLTDNPNAPAVRVEEEQILKKKYPLDYNALTAKLITRYSDFKRNSKYHKLRKEFMKDKNLSRTRYLDPDNPNSTSKDFFSPLIYKKFDKHYTKN